MDARLVLCGVQDGEMGLAGSEKYKVEEIQRLERRVSLTALFLSSNTCDPAARQ